MIALGMDMFDCVMPTRLARHANAFTPYGTINLKNERFKFDREPIMKQITTLVAILAVPTCAI